MNNSEKNSQNRKALLPRNIILNSLSNLIDPKLQAQIHGVDLTVKSVYGFKSIGVIDFDNKKRELPDLIDIEIKNDQESPYWLLPQGGYIVRYNETVTVPQDACGIILPRSTLMRIGATLQTALWDAGYSGQGLGLLIVTNTEGIKIFQNARIGQLIFFNTPHSNEKYSGIYQNEKD
ncbi:MAG: deoxyuridine 5'-triphosphate nucleotidohydrolase [Candidatus Ranarchaeia archaeon]